MHETWCQPSVDDLGELKMPNPSYNRLELQLPMLCRSCGGKILLPYEKSEAQMNGGLCQLCALLREGA